MKFKEFLEESKKFNIKAIKKLIDAEFKVDSGMGMNDGLVKWMKNEVGEDIVKIKNNILYIDIQWVTDLSQSKATTKYQNFLKKMTKFIEGFTLTQTMSYMKDFEGDSPAVVAKIEIEMK